MLFNLFMYLIDLFPFFFRSCLGSLKNHLKKIELCLLMKCTICLLNMFMSM